MISVNDISFSYGEKSVISHLSFKLDEGESIAVMGASGSGKTTLARLLLGLEKPTAGTITGLENLRVSAVFQEDRLLEWYTSLDNVSLAAAGATKRERDERALELLTMLELADAAKKPIRELSGGMQRRVAIARALARGGGLIILDEPLKGLDAALKKRVAEIIRAAFKTILLITHDEEEVSMFECKTTVTL